MSNAVLIKAEEVARSQIGYREGPKNNETIFGKWFGMDFVSWCAIFQSWISFKSGTTYLGKPWRFASTIAARDHAKRNGRWIIQPTVGTIAMMAHTSTTGHVGWVIALLMRNGVLYVVTIEGNTNDQGAREGNGVWLRTRAASSWDGYIVLDQTFMGPGQENPPEDDMPTHFYKIRDEDHPDKPHPTLGDAIWGTDTFHTKFISEPPWVHEKNLGWWNEEKVELIPKALHDWLVSDADVTMIAALGQMIKDALASETDNGPGSISDATIDKIVSQLLDTQAKRLSS